MPSVIMEETSTMQGGKKINWQARAFKANPSLSEGSLQNPMKPPYSPPMVAARLSAVRESLDMQKSEMADALGIDRSSYTKIESGSKPLKPEYAFRLWELYAIPMDFTYRGQIRDLPPSLSSAVTRHLKQTSE